MRILMVLAVAAALAGCSKRETKPEAAAVPAAEVPAAASSANATPTDTVKSAADSCSAGETCKPQ